MSTEQTIITPSTEKQQNTQSPSSPYNRPSPLRLSPRTTETELSATTAKNSISLRERLSIRGKNKPKPIVGYNAERICNFYDRSPLVVGWRLNSLGFPLLGWYIGLLTDELLQKQNDPITQRKRGAELRQHLVTSGSVALIKSGQALSLRPDLLKNTIWAEELGKLVDEVGSFPDWDAMDILQEELVDLRDRISTVKTKGLGDSDNGHEGRKKEKRRKKKERRLSKLEKRVRDDASVLSLFEFSNANRAVASASIGQVYKARIKRGPALEAAIGKEEALEWGGKTVAIKVQRPDAAAAASLDMYLIRRTATWLGKFRGGDLAAIADTFGEQLFGELDYVREADNCERFRGFYGGWEDVSVPKACLALTRKKVLVMEWVDGEKGPWDEKDGIDMVSMGLKCSVDQLLSTGLFHADPHRGNLLRSPSGELSFIDFGMMADVTEEERYGLIGLAIGLQNKDLSLVTENLLKLGFLEDTTQLDLLVPRLREAFINSTGGSGKGSDVNFGRLQAEIDAITSDNVLQFKTPGFFTVIIRSLTILEGFALSVDPKFRLVRGAYPYVLAQLLAPDDDSGTPEAYRKLLVRLFTVNGEEKEIDWERLRDFLRLAQKAQKTYKPSESDTDDKGTLSRQTIDLFFRFMTSKTGLFLKGPLIIELAETIDGMASIGEANLLRLSRGLIRPIPGGNGPVNTRRIDELRLLFDTIQNALVEGDGDITEKGRARMESLMTILREVVAIVSDSDRMEDAMPLVQEVVNVFQMVAVQVLEIRGSRAMRNILQLVPN